MKKTVLIIGTLLFVMTGSAFALNTISLDVGDCIDVPPTAYDSSLDGKSLLRKRICFAGAVSDSLVINVLSSSLRRGGYESSSSSSYYLKNNKSGKPIKFQSMIIEFYSNNMINLTF